MNVPTHLIRTYSIASRTAGDRGGSVLAKRGHATATRQSLVLRVTESP